MRRVAVIGEMRELGEFATVLHRESGRRAAACGIDLLVAIGGAPAKALADAAVDAGLDAAAVRHFETSDEAAAPVAAMLRAGDVVLVKGSRGTRTDIVADALKAEGRLVLFHLLSGYMHIRRAQFVRGTSRSARRSRA